MIPHDPAAGVDPAAVALAARRLRALLPPMLPPVSTAGWAGPAAAAAAGLVTSTFTAYATARQAVEETADALAATATALAAAVATRAAADRLWAAEGTAATGPDADPAVVATLARLQGDAAAQVAAADARCAARLRAIGHGGPLPPLVAPVSPEQSALAVLRAGGWGSVPTALVGPLAALLGEAQVADDPGLPVLAREVAARIALADRPALLVPEADGTPRQYLQATADGAVAEVWGDLATARRVVVIVSGTGTSVGHLGPAQAQGDATYAELRRQAGPDVAVIVWDGSPEPPDIVAAARQSYARQAAPRLIRFVDGLDLAAGASLTLVGHSYGAVVAGLAVHQGLRPAALVGVAPAGFGPGVRSAADLGGVPTYVLEKSDDPIRDEYAVEDGIRAAGDGPFALLDAARRELPGLQRLPDPLLSGDLLPGDLLDDAAGRAGIGELGTDPVCLPGAVELASGHDGVDLAPLGFDGAVHKSYFDPGSVSLRQIVAVAAGRPPDPGGGHCPVFVPR